MRSVSQLILESELLTVKVRILFEKNMLLSEGVCIVCTQFTQVSALCVCVRYYKIIGFT